MGCGCVLLRVSAGFLPAARGNLSFSGALAVRAARACLCAPGAIFDLLAFLALLLTGLFMGFKAMNADPNVRVFYYINAYVCGVATFAYFAMLSGMGWETIMGCRQFFYVRWVPCLWRVCPHGRGRRVLRVLRVALCGNSHAETEARDWAGQGMWGMYSQPAFNARGFPRRRAWGLGFSSGCAYVCLRRGFRLEFPCLGLGDTGRLGTRQTGGRVERVRGVTGVGCGMAQAGCCGTRGVGHGGEKNGCV